MRPDALTDQCHSRRGGQGAQAGHPVSRCLDAQEAGEGRGAGVGCDGAPAAPEHFQHAQKPTRVVGHRRAFVQQKVTSVAESGMTYSLAAPPARALAFYRGQPFREGKYFAGCEMVCAYLRFVCFGLFCHSSISVLGR
jgi:hypothetical protein